MKNDAMKPPVRTFAFPAVSAPRWLQRMFNLNDSRWGRGDDASAPSERPEGAAPENDPPKPAAAPQSQPDRRGAAQSGPPDLDELWRDFNRKLGGLFQFGPGSIMLPFENVHVCQSQHG